MDTITDYEAHLIQIDCIPPREYYDYSIDLDDDNSILYIEDALDEEQLKTYLEGYRKVKRSRGGTAFGRKKPRLEVAYTPDGSPITYSRVKHRTLKYPQHVDEVIPIFLDLLSEEADEEFNESGWQRSTGIDIIYPSIFPGSGSIGAHSDDESLNDDGRHWDLILIYSLGQTRYLRVRDKDKSRGFINVSMPHNSLVAMYGPTFQSKYTHQIDRLKNQDELGDRHSINVRFFR